VGLVKHGYVGLGKALREYATQVDTSNLKAVTYVAEEVGISQLATEVKTLIESSVTSICIGWGGRQEPEMG